MIKKELSVIIPAYNEEERIVATLSEVASFLRGAGYDFEILVVDDGSTDETARRVAAARQHYPEIIPVTLKPNRGKGEAVKEGIRRARKELCLFMDADNSTSIREWPAFEKAFAAGVDAVAASRHLEGSRIIHPQPFARRFLGAGYRVLCRLLFGLKNSDFNCGFKAFRTSLARDVYSQARMRDWTFDVEIFCLLRKKNARLKETPVRWEHHQKTSGGIAPLRTAISTWGSLMRLKVRF